MTLYLSDKLTPSQVAHLVQGLNLLMIEKENGIQLAEFYGNKDKVGELNTELAHMKLLAKAVAENMDEKVINYDL